MNKVPNKFAFSWMLIGLFLFCITYADSAEANYVASGSKKKSQLTLYYFPVQRLTSRPLGKNDILAGYEKKIVIELRDSKPMDALVERLGNTDYSQFKKSRDGKEVNIRILCQILTVDNTKFEFAVGHNTKLIYVNGLIGAEDSEWYFNNIKHALYESMKPLLPKDLTHNGKDISVSKESANQSQ